MDRNVVLMCGLPAAGKTTTAARLHQFLGGALIRSCDVYAALGIDLPAWVRRTQGFTVDVSAYLCERDQAYMVMANMLATHLASSLDPVIVDAVHGERAKREHLYRVSGAYAARALLVWCRCSEPAEIARRFARRRGREDAPENEASHLSVYRHITSLWEDPREDEAVTSGAVRILECDTLSGSVHANSEASIVERVSSMLAARWMPREIRA